MARRKQLFFVFETAEQTVIWAGAPVDFPPALQYARRMKRKLVAVLLALPLAGAAPVGYKYWSAAQLQNISKRLSAKHEKTSLENLANFGTDRAIMVHRDTSGMAELHETDADVIVVLSGTGTIVVGGKMEGGKKTQPNELRGPSIEGGARQKIGPGDILHIPRKTPHQVLLEPGTKISYFTLKVKE